MNIVRISAGLGNQMFQYAFYLALKAENEETGIDISDFKYRKYHNGYELEKIFNISPLVLEESQVKEIADTSKSLLDCIRRDIFRRKRQVKGTIYTEKGIFYDDSVWNRENTFFQGFWQSWKYFDKIHDQVISQFQFKTPLSVINKAVADAMKQCESVSIHIRRGDYTKKRRWNEIGSICSLDYYGWAMANIRQQLGEDVHYFVFSDDMAWVRKNLKIPNATYIDWNNNGDSYIDMQLPSLCKHNIIANSSFSWWGAYLNQNPDKIVIAPNKWYRNNPTPDLLLPSWTQVAID